ncbi:hypothetical protein FWH13_03650 [Candidatus Saccharibacteria bacterium]|nr:hypothetical protein [Candidatus Saccharibacteria bacterium]
MSEEQSITALADKLLTARGLTELGHEQYQEFREDLVERIRVAIDKAMLDALPEEKLNEVERLADDPEVDPALIWAIVLNAGLDRDAIVQHVLTQFDRIYMETIGGQNA